MQKKTLAILPAAGSILLGVGAVPVLANEESAIVENEEQNTNSAFDSIDAEIEKQENGIEENTQLMNEAAAKTDQIINDLENASVTESVEESIAENQQNIQATENEVIQNQEVLEKTEDEAQQVQEKVDQIPVIDQKIEDNKEQITRQEEILTDQDVKKKETETELKQEQNVLDFIHKEIEAEENNSQKLELAVTKAQEEVKNQTETVSNLETEIGSLGKEVNDLEEKLPELEKSLEQAVIEDEQSREELKKAQDQYQILKDQYDEYADPELMAAYEQAKTIYDQAVQKANIAEQQMHDYQEARDAALAQHDKVVNALNFKKQELDQAKDSYEQAVQAVNEAAKVRDQAQQKIDALGNESVDFDELQKNLDQASAQVNKGSLGFFESLLGNPAFAQDAQKAINVLKDNKLTNYLNLGDPTCATNLDNMAKTIQHLKRCNELRALHGLDALRVSLYLTAIAQKQTNYGDVHYNHAGAYNVGENLVWCSDKKDPYKLWYDEEKAIYDNALNSGMTPQEIEDEMYYDVGHYLNIINPEYTATGYAYLPNNRYGTSQGQTFIWDGASMSVEEYEVLFNQYYTNVKTKLQQAQDALANAGSAEEKEQAEEELKKAQSLLDEAEQKQAETKQIQEAINEERNQLQNEADRISSEIDSLISSISDSYNALLEAQAEISTVEGNYNELKEQKDAFDQEHSDLLSTLNIAQTTLESAKDAQEKTSENRNQISSEFSQTSSSLESLKNLLLETETVLKQAVIDQDKALKNADQLSDRLASSLNHLTELNKEKTTSESVIHSLKDKISVLEAEMKNANEILAELNEESEVLNSIKNNPDQFKDQLAALKAQIETLKSMINTGQSKLADLKEKQAQLLEDYDKAKDYDLKVQKAKTDWISVKNRELNAFVSPFDLLNASVSEYMGSRGQVDEGIKKADELRKIKEGFIKNNLDSIQNEKREENKGLVSEEREEANKEKSNKAKTAPTGVSEWLIPSMGLFAASGFGLIKARKYIRKEDLDSFHL